MCASLLISLGFLGFVFLTLSENVNYEVVGVSCADNEEVSCLLIKCPAGVSCPAEDFCYNPKCVCRRGYRRLKGACVKKQRNFRLGPGGNEL